LAASSAAATSTAASANRITIAQNLATGFIVASP
jgi:hypothetical protein